jgi:hypothetical protein
LGMTVHQVETEMPAAELVEWLAHFRLSLEEHQREAEKQKARRR